MRGTKPEKESGRLLGEKINWLKVVRKNQIDMEVVHPADQLKGKPNLHIWMYGAKANDIREILVILKSLKTGG